MPVLRIYFKATWRKTGQETTDSLLCTATWFNEGGFARFTNKHWVYTFIRSEALFIDTENTKEWIHGFNRAW